MERHSLQFQEKSVQSVFQNGESKFVQLSFDPGEGLKKHKTSHVLALIVLTGQIRFTVDDTVETLSASEMLTLEPSREHAVEAVERSTVLLVLTPAPKPVAPPTSEIALDHENAFLRPELIDQIAPELQPLVRDHVAVCKTLDAVLKTFSRETVAEALTVIEHELNSHFKVEEEFLFPRMAAHVGGADVGPVARLIEEHQIVRELFAETKRIAQDYEAQSDAQTEALLKDKMKDLARALLNHLGKEDTHLFPMASRLLTAEEKAAVAEGLKQAELGEATC